jgi:hypothetical protein
MTRPSRDDLHALAVWFTFGMWLIAFYVAWQWARAWTSPAANVGTAERKATGVKLFRGEH